MKASLWTLAWLTLALPALARPPPGTDLKSAEHLWWECWHQPNPASMGPNGSLSCCSESDGHNIADQDLRQAADQSQWQVLIEGRWWDVPNDTIVSKAETKICGQEPNVEHQTEAKAWYRFDRAEDGALKLVHFFCFRLPIEY